MAADKNAKVSGSAGAQVADLRSQLDGLVEHRAMPIINDARDGMADKIQELTGRVRSRPIAAIAITAAVAFLCGRLLR
jgi:ElaB/YqjD/DUF883 family membrane-anchored ribosome-binding protein